MSDPDGPGAGFPKKKKTHKSSTPSDKSDGKDRFSQLRDMGLLPKVNEFAEREVTLACEVEILWVDGVEDDDTDEGHWSVSIQIDPSNVDSNYRRYLKESFWGLGFDGDMVTSENLPINDLLKEMQNYYPAINFGDAYLDTFDQGDGNLHIKVMYPNGLELPLSEMKEQAAEIAAYVSYYLFSVDGPVPPKTIDNRKKNGQTHSDSDSDSDSDGIQLDFANDVSYEKARRFYEEGFQDSVEDQYLYRLKTDDVHDKAWWLKNVFQDTRDNDSSESQREYKYTTTIALIRNTQQPLNKQGVVVATQQVFKSVLKF